MRARGASVVLAVLVVAGPLIARAASPPASGEFSISVGEQDRPAPRDAQTESWRARVDEARRRYEAYAGRAYERYLLFSGAKARRAALPANGARGFDAIMNDPTLRRNDIYVSEQGFMVFRGRPEPPYAPADFQPMPQDQVRALSLKVAAEPK